MVRARGTSLGADNAIGLALGLGLADEPDAVHGPLEILATVEEETGLSTGAMTNRIDKLEAKGLVRRRSDAVDRRSVVVSLTPRGKRLIDEAIRIRLDAADVSLQGISKNEQARRRAWIAEVEETIAAAEQHGDFEPFHNLMEVLARPFEFDQKLARYALPPRPEQVVTQTFCGT